MKNNKNFIPQEIITKPHSQLNSEPTARVLKLMQAEKNKFSQPKQDIITRKYKTPADILAETMVENLDDNNDIFKYSRKKMINEQLIARGINNPYVLNAMAKVARHQFVSEALHFTAYSDRPLPIAAGQTISQPYTVALMCQLLLPEPNMKILEIGTGSGYQTAILYEMGMEVYSVERIEELFSHTFNLLKNTFSYHKLNLALGDGTLGYPKYAPYDRIIVAAGGPIIPQSLKDQMAEGAIMLIPVGEDHKKQRLVRVTKVNGQFREEDFGATTFVDLIGSQGWQ